MYVKIEKQNRNLEITKTFKIGFFVGKNFINVKI